MVNLYVREKLDINDKDCFKERLNVLRVFKNGVLFGTLKIRNFLKQAFTVNFGSLQVPVRILGS